MTDSTVIAARRYSDLHPGYQLVHAVEAAIPVSWLRLDLIAQERKDLPVVEEFVLRLSDQGVDTIQEISGVLGIDAEIVQAAVAGQLSAETVSYLPGLQGERTVVLTPAGKRAVQDLQVVTPRRIEHQRAFDRLLWKPTLHTRSELITRAQAANDGRIILPSRRTNEVTADDVSARALNRLLDEHHNGKAPVEVLAVEDITQQPRLCLPAVLLVFTATDFDDVRLGVVVDDLYSEDHHKALIEAGGRGRLEIRVEPPTGEPDLPGELLDQRVSHETVRSLQRRADPATPDDNQPTGRVRTKPSADSVTARTDLDTLPVRSVPVFEHRDLLMSALDSARSRFLLATPLISKAVLNDDMFAKLEVMLRRTGLTAHIAYGLGRADQRHDAEAVKRLQALTRRHRNLTVVELSSEQPNVLVFDDNWVNSNFDWLSFRGAPTRPYRREEGTLVRVKSAVDERYTHYADLIDSLAR
ncbi:hypothetical protein ACIGNX_22045 [Actinosynnema sp. NPDC053489]|uniref:hypothetical protein n=1 Tax=Actinosynnema sp. NPDC053489 TaxID=3363916 RepID=UPI0037CC26B7